jgi:hypothetical protein
MVKPTTVLMSLLGSNCWKPIRFCGGACDKVPTCKYPEKGTCQAHIDQVFIVRIPKRTYAKDPK